MSTDPNRVWGGSQDELAKIQRKIARQKAKIEAIKRLIAKCQTGRWPDPQRVADLGLDLTEAIIKLQHIEAKYDAGLIEWGT
jgi:hypothetical protein